MASHMAIQRASRHGRLIDAYKSFDMLDIAVVGAGPAGLSVAAALLQCKSKPSVKVSMYLVNQNGTTG